MANQQALWVLANEVVAAKSPTDGRRTASALTILAELKAMHAQADQVDASLDAVEAGLDYEKAYYLSRLGDIENLGSKAEWKGELWTAIREILFADLSGAALQSD